jgi:hypothetical protein
MRGGERRKQPNEDFPEKATVGKRFVVSENRQEDKSGNDDWLKKVLRVDKAAVAKLQVIAEIEASLKKLAESTDDKAERKALETTEKAVNQMKE